MGAWAWLDACSCSWAFGVVGFYGCAAPFFLPARYPSLRIYLCVDDRQLHSSPSRVVDDPMISTSSFMLVVMMPLSDNPQGGRVSRESALRRILDFIFGCFHLRIELVFVRGFQSRFIVIFHLTTSSFSMYLR